MALKPGRNTAGNTVGVVVVVEVLRIIGWHLWRLRGERTEMKTQKTWPK